MSEVAFIDQQSIQLAELVGSLPNGSEFTVNAPGSFISVKVSNVDLIIRTDTGSRVTVQQGDKVILPRTFGSFIVENQSGSTANFTLVYGSGDFDRNSITGTVQVGSGSNFSQSADVTVAVTTPPVLISAANANRKKLLISNNGLVACRIGNASVTLATGFRLQPNQGLELETTAAVYGVLEAAGTTAITVNEIEV